jgi:PAS domain S-box-containing protein
MLNELYQVVTEITNDCLWEWDLKNKRIFWIDGGHKRLFGYQVENALIPQSFWENCLHPDDKLRILSKLDKVLIQEPGSIWEEEYRFKMANGEYAHVHDRAHIFCDGNKRPFRMIGATQDITSRKFAEIELLESEQKLSLIAKQTINAIIITDDQGQITWINNAFTQITGYSSSEILGSKLVIFLQGINTDPLTLQNLRRKIKSNQPFIFQINNYSKSGRLYWLNIQGQPLMNEHGNSERYFVIGTDITERIFLENKLVEERQAKQREITHAILTAQENERADIGRELHDNINQILVVIKMHLTMAIKNEDSRELYLNKIIPPSNRGD